MTCMPQHLNDYLATRRSLGYDLSTDEFVLRKFVEYAGSVGSHHISTELFLAWRDHYGNASNATWGGRLVMVRGFAAWLQARDDRTEVPPAGLIPARPVRSKPYIYTQQQLAQLVDEAGRLGSPYGLRALLHQTLFGLIAVTGMRISEALRLERRDVDLDGGILHIRRSKNGGERSIPVRSCAVARLAHYAVERDRLTDTDSPRFFVREDGQPAGDEGARYNFALVSQRIGIRRISERRNNGTGPRIHDLRHTLAVHTMLDWFREGRDIDREMYRLSAYLGHTKPEHTYWYIEAVPELLQLAAERAETRHREISP